MAKTKTAPRKKKDESGESFLQLDDKRHPIKGLFAGGPQARYPREYELIQSLKVNSSASFARERLNVINAIRTHIHRNEGKKYIVKKIDLRTARIWRVGDNAVTRFGGRQKGGPYRKEDNAEQ